MEQSFCSRNLLLRFFQIWHGGVHKLMEKGILKNKKFKKVLELGGYYGNHHYYLKMITKILQTDLLYGEKLGITDG